MMSIRRFLFSLISVALPVLLNAQASKPLPQLQQDFVDQRFGMFIHFNMPTFMSDDWADPDAKPALFNPAALDCNQWAKAAKSAKMTYGALTTKHHSGFCIWDTKTTDYNVMNSPLKRDVVREYVDAFRANGLNVMLYYSILDTHHKLRPGFITKQHVAMVKAQLTELLSNYGPISALIIDGWDAPWSRISYDDIPFEEIYRHIKSIQPNCLVMDLNAAKYPAEALFYTDIKSYEQGAGQHISKETNQLPALSCLPINNAWFWKASFPDEPVKDPNELVQKNLIPFNRAYCTFLLNVAPNRQGLIDDNALAALTRIGQIWQPDPQTPKLPPFDAPIISHNLAKHRPSNATWSNDMWIMDFGNDDNFKTAWESNPSVAKPVYEVILGTEQTFNLITLLEKQASLTAYRLEYFSGNTWKPIPATTADNRKATTPGRARIHRFKSVRGSRVRVLMDAFTAPPAIAELGVYREKGH
jgi:alpha-L-fucosidase